MLELLYHQLTKHFILTNNTPNNFFNIRVQYKDNKSIGGIAHHVIAANDQLIWQDETLYEPSIQAEVLVTTHSEVLYNKFSELGSDGKFQIQIKKKISKQMIIDIVLHDLFDLHPPLHHELTSSNPLLQDFINLLFAFIDTEYREGEEKWAFGSTLKQFHNHLFEQTKQNAILFSKCVVLMDFLKLTHQEISTILIELGVFQQLKSG